MIDQALADVVDVELQLHRDRDLPREELRRRDRHIGLTLRAGDATDPDARRALLASWVHAVQREEGTTGAGETFVRVYHAVGWLLILLGLVSGVGTASAVLGYDGTHPVNVVHFLAVFVGLQLILLLLFVFSTTLWRLRDRVPGFDGLYALLRLAFDAVAGFFERRLSAERRATLHAARGRLRASQIVYGDAERWLLVSLAQRFGLFFNLGALATCLYLVAFSDLAFAWQTTLRVDAGDFHRLVTILGAPWSWIYPDGVPGYDVVAASRYFRIDSTFTGAGHTASDAALLGQWWRFLVLCLCFYGLLPRAVLGLIASLRLRRALSVLRLDHGEIASVLERLSSPLVNTRAPVPEAAPPDATLPAVGPAPTPGRDAACDAVIWGDIPLDPAALIGRRFGWTVRRVERAGVDDTRTDDAAIQAITSAGGDRSPIVLVAEAFEAPTRESRAFVARLRAAAGATRPLVVGLVAENGSPPGVNNLRVWQRQLASLGDPYLRVEALVEEP